MESGTELGPYKILSPLGKGGMAEVYRAQDTRLHREVAIKILSERLNTDQSSLIRFQREAKTLAALSHPNILTIFDVGFENGVSFVVMELLEGETLRNRIAQYRLHWSQAIEIGIQIANGLSAAHSKGIIHRDLKPENLFLASDDHLKILDFGLATWQHDFNASWTEFQTTLEQATQKGIAIGTIPYMSPEQVKGMPLDARSDIYSFGCVLHEMISGQCPFMRQTQAETISAILNENQVQLAKFDPSVPMGLEQVVNRCLKKDPAERFQSARDMVTDLKQIDANQPDSKNIKLRSNKEQQFKSRNLKVISAAVILILLSTFLVYRHEMKKTAIASPAQLKSIAVLPLQNLSADPEQDYFVDGMTEALINELSKIKALQVISRTSMMEYKNSRESLPQIANELQADALIEGSVMRSTDRVRIAVQLIDGKSDKNLWANSYDHNLKDIFALQAEVAQAIAQQVRAVITPQERRRFVKNSSIDPESYELYLKGCHIMTRGGLEDVKKAIDYFEAGIKKDPKNALIYTGLADAYIHKMSDVHESPVEAMAKARAAAEKALELDESLAPAHTSLASIKLFYDWNWEGAEHELKRAMELNPGYPLTYRMYGAYLTIIGRNAEAAPYFKKAQKLDPLYERNYVSEGYSFFMAHKYDEAIQQYQRGLEMEPDPIAHFGLTLALAQKGDYAEAISEGEKATKQSDAPLLLTSLASAYALAGRRVDSSRVLRQLEEISKHQGPAPAWHGNISGYVCPYEVAGVYAQLGEKDRALIWLDKAYQSRSCLYWLRQDPRFDSLRSDSQFKELLKKINFPQLH